MPDRDVDFSRRYERKIYKTSILFAHKGRTYSGTIQNISLGGAFIATAHVNQLSVGDSVTLAIPYAGREKTLKQTGRISWQNNEGFAVDFQ